MRFIGVAALATLALFAALACSAVHAGTDQPQAANVPQSLKDEADEAKAAFRKRVEPPIAKLMILEIGDREAGDAQRKYLIRSYDAAIDALVVEAAQPQQLPPVQKALTRIVRAADSTRADAIYADMMKREGARGAAGAHAAAAASRHAVALDELPKALVGSFSTFGMGSFAGGKGMPGKSWGTGALPAYRLAAVLEPDEPWNWVVIAWLSDSAQAKIDACARAAASAGFATDARARIECYRLRGQLYQQAGDMPHAREMFEAQLGVARQAHAQPGGGVDARALTMALDALGNFHAATGDAGAARAAYEEALQIREDLARAAPDSLEAGLDLIAVHDRLRRLPDQANGSNPRDELTIEFGLYNRIAARDRYRPMYGPDQWTAISGMVVLMGSISTIVVGVVLLALYRRRVGRLMTSVAARAAGVTGRFPAMRNMAAGHFRLRVLNPADAAGLPSPTAGALADASKALRRAAWVQAAGGLAFAVVALELWLAAGDMDASPGRVALLMTIWIWPLVLVLSLLWSGDGRRQRQAVGVYFGVLALEIVIVGFRMTPMQVYGVTLPGMLQLLYFWVAQVLPSAVLLFFVSRRVRAVGPVVLAFLLVTILGGMLAHVEASSYAGQQWALATLAHRGVPMGAQTWVIFLLGMLLSAPFAWALVVGIRTVYRAKWISDQTLAFDSIWLVHTLVLVLLHLAQDIGVYGWVGLLAFLAYKAVTTIGQWPLAWAAARRPKARLLLLRVFGFRRRTERFFDALSARWRYAGPIQLITAPDLATNTIDPDELMDYLVGRLRRRFIFDAGDLQQRVDALDDKPDIDGRFRVNEFFCGQDAWRSAVRALMVRSDLVVMDLRGFTERNQGCIFELQALLDFVPARRIVMLVDGSTDESLLRATLDDCRRRVGADSPNLAGDAAATLLEVGPREIVAVNGLLRLADEVLGAPPPARAGAMILGRAGYFAGVSIPLPAHGLTLGRGLPGDGRLAFDEQCNDISRDHCSLRYDDRAACFQVTDLASSNGTFLMPMHRRLPAHETVLCRAGQFIQLGEENLLELLSPQPDLAPA